jgi:hypothetical protein
VSDLTEAFRTIDETVAALIANLEAVTTAIESTEQYQTSHGTHFVGVEARKLLDRITDE